MSVKRFFMKDSVTSLYLYLGSKEEDLSRLCSGIILCKMWETIGGIGD